MTSAKGAKRTIFFVSDGTGITAANVGHTLMTQFQGTPYRECSLPFIDSEHKAREAAATIARAHVDDGLRPIVFSTLIEDSLREIIADSGALDLDLFNVYIRPLEDELAVTSVHASGQSHGMADKDAYRIRMDAVNFALQHDDGATTRRYTDADVVLIGVSRCGKTPTCVYMAMQFGIRAANYPLTEEDMDRNSLPEVLHRYRSKLFGLSINPDELSRVRKERRSDSRYATLRQCQREVREVEALFRHCGVGHINTTSVSVEEITTHIIQQLGLTRRTH